MRNRRKDWGLVALAGMLAGMAAAPAQPQGATEIVLHSFGYLSHGANPQCGLLRDSAGNLYGTAIAGGAANLGVVYKVDTAGDQTVLHNFKGGADGASPGAAVIEDSSGNLYGTTEYGGTAGDGVVYKIAATGETVLYSFLGGADGANPSSGVIRDSAGNLYGTTEYGGTAGAGVVYKLDTTGQETVLYSFTGGADGKQPMGGVILGAAGNLYGTTVNGGIGNSGVIYKLDANGHETVLYSFTGGTDGAGPQAGVIRDSAGNLYGTTEFGGTAEYGVVFKLDTAGRETVLHNFTGVAGDGYPSGGVIRDPAGNLYGTTSLGGVVYKLSATGQETVLYKFEGQVNGGQPQGGLIRDSAGNLYGTTRDGDDPGPGAVYKLDAAGQETVLYSFPAAAGGTEPLTGVIADAAGNLYGTTVTGGPANAGVVFKLDASRHYTVLYGFMGGTDGAQPGAGVVRDSAGNLYGTTVYGGTSGWGVVYKVDATGRETVLYNFTGGADGGYPQSGVIRDASGNLYGTTGEGGSAPGYSGNGVVYRLDPSGHQTVLHMFTGSAAGEYPSAVIRDSAGNLYGTAQGPWMTGLVFKVDPAGEESVLYSFTGGADGGGPSSGVVQDSAGNLYGTAAGGGTSGWGVVYKLDPAGHETVLYNFVGGTTCANIPTHGVILDPVGNVYGTSADDGVAGCYDGAVYEVDTAGNYSMLYAFPSGGTAGPSGLIRDAAGDFYGTDGWGGKFGSGVVFKLKMAVTP